MLSCSNEWCSVFIAHLFSEVNSKGGVTESERKGNPYLETSRPMTSFLSSIRCPPLISKRANINLDDHPSHVVKKAKHSEYVIKRVTMCVIQCVNKCAPPTISQVWLSSREDDAPCWAPMQSAESSNTTPATTLLLLSPNIPLAFSRRPRDSEYYSTIKRARRATI